MVYSKAGRAEQNPSLRNNETRCYSTNLDPGYPRDRSTVSDDAGLDTTISAGQRGRRRAHQPDFRLSSLDRHNIYISTVMSLKILPVKLPRSATTRTQSSLITIVYW